MVSVGPDILDAHSSERCRWTPLPLIRLLATPWSRSKCI